MGSLRIFVASPDERLRLALILFLADEPNLVVVGIADRITGLFNQLEASGADVLLLDWEVHDHSMVNLLRDLKNLENRPETIIFSSREEKKETIMAAGADYFISKDSPPDSLMPILNDIRGVDYAS